MSQLVCSDCFKPNNCLRFTRRTMHLLSWFRIISAAYCQQHEFVWTTNEFYFFRKKKYLLLTNVGFTFSLPRMNPWRLTPWWRSIIQTSYLSSALARWEHVCGKSGRVRNGWDSSLLEGQFQYKKLLSGVRLKRWIRIIQAKGIELWLIKPRLFTGTRNTDI